MTGPVRLDHVVIAVSDWDRSIAFYRDVLGAQVVDHPGGRVANGSLSQPDVAAPPALFSVP